MVRSVAVEAPAKINLFLRVLGIRPDGYHEVVTLLQSVSLCDEVLVELRGRDVDLEVIGAELGAPEDNLAYRAAAAYRAEAGLEAGVRIRLLKRIPAGAGLGGGSSDAAAVLECMSLLCGDPLSERLHGIAAGLGSDVPFFLQPTPLALGTGRGEVLEPLTPLPAGHLVLSLPPIHVSTPEAYAALDLESGDAVAEAGGGSAVHPRGWDDVLGQARNDFEPVVCERYPEVRRSLEALREAGARLAMMSGSGGASFGLFGDAGEAKTAASAMTDTLGWPCLAIETLVRPPIPVSS